MFADFRSILRAAQPQQPDQRYRGKRQSQRHDQLHDQEFADLAVIGGGGDRAGLVPDFARHDVNLVEILGAQRRGRQRKIGERRHHREISGFEVGGRRVGDPCQHRDHRDLAQRGFQRGVDQRDEPRIDHAAGGRRGPLMQAENHADVGQRQQRAEQRQEAHDVGNRVIGHEAAEQEHAEQRQHRADQRQHGNELLVELQFVDEPPGDAFAGTGNGAEYKNDDHRAEQRGADVGFEFARQAHQQESDDAEGAGKNDFLIEGNVAEAHAQRERDEYAAAAEDPPVGRGGCGPAAEQRVDFSGAAALRAQSLRGALSQPQRTQHARHRNGRDGERHQVNTAIDFDFPGFRQRLRAAEHVEIDQRHQHAAADDGDAAQRLHGGVHQLALRGIYGIALRIDAWHRFNGHCIGDHVLQHIADGGEQHAGHIPRARRKHRAHRVAVGEQADHDQQTRRDHAGAEEYQHAFPAPDQIDQMAQRHFQRPRHARPETQRGKECRRQPEIILDEKGADDAGQSGNAGRHVHHQRRQVRPAHLAAEFENVEVDPLPELAHSFIITYCFY